MSYKKSYSTQHVITSLIENWREKLDQNFLVGAVWTDLSKTFDCIPHDLLIAKLAAYGFDLNALALIFTYLKNRKQSVQINNTHSSFGNIISGVPQGSIVGPILFNLSINDLFYIIEKASIFNFADDNTLSAFSKTIEGLLHILQSESLKTIKWFKENKMIVNADKFQVLLIDKRKQDHTNEVVQIEEQSIKAVPLVELLGIEVDDKLSFNLSLVNL